jgi:hypothetical protein
LSAIHRSGRLCGRRRRGFVARAALVAVALGAAAPAAADVSGVVLVAGSGSPGTPIAGATVHVQAQPSPAVTTAADGSFTLPTDPGGPYVLAASVTYDRDAAVNYTIGGAIAFDGDSGLEIRMAVLPAADDPGYAPPNADLCGSCHIGQYDAWLGSNHRLAAMDGWVLDLFSGDGTPGGGAGYVFRDLHDPDDTGFCATCHAPMADVFDPGEVFLDEVVSSAALEGVACVGCHQIDSVNDNVNALHLLGNATYRFPDGGAMNPTFQYVWGPLDDVTFTGMSPSHAPFFDQSRLCASCHQYINPTTGAPGQNTFGQVLPERVNRRHCRRRSAPHGPSALKALDRKRRFGAAIRPHFRKRWQRFDGRRLPIRVAELQLARHVVPLAALERVVGLREPGVFRSHLARQCRLRV